MLANLRAPPLRWPDPSICRCWLRDASLFLQGGSHNNRMYNQFIFIPLPSEVMSSQTTGMIPSENGTHDILRPIHVLLDQIPNSLEALRFEQ